MPSQNELRRMVYPFGSNGGSFSRPHFFITILMVLFLFLLGSCHLLPEHPEPEFPPCVKETTPKANSVINYQGQFFKVTFSKELEERTLTTEYIYLVQGVVDYYFLRDLESTTPISSTRLPLLVPIKIKKLSKEGEATILEITPQVKLKGDTLYSLVLTRGIRDKLRQLDGNRRTGSRPLNVCPDSQGNWPGEVEDYKKGQSKIITYRTKPEPPRGGIPRIVEVMATPPSGLKNGEYVEIFNADPKKSLQLCGLFLGDSSTSAPREIISFKKGAPCKEIPPNGLGVIVEPDYSMSANPYHIPSSALLFTTKGSTTLLSGGISSGESVLILQNDDVLEKIDPNVVSDGNWPSGKSLEKCKANAPNNPSYWKPSKQATGGTPGTKNTVSCP